MSLLSCQPLGSAVPSLASRTFVLLCLVQVCMACGSEAAPPRVPNGCERNADGEVVCDASVEEDATPEPAPCAKSGKAVIERSCLPCHSSELEGVSRNGAPLGVDFDDPQVVTALGADMLQRATVDLSMPPTGALPECDQQTLADYLTDLADSCTPDCDGRSCGSDGCGGRCGSCAKGESCSTAGACSLANCTPSCDGRSCGDDGCGGVCGSCSGTDRCVDGGCVCIPDCDGKSCAGDGCGTACGDCGAQICNTEQDACVSTCTPNCDGRACGDDGCSGSCGDCDAGDACVANSVCTCAPDCEGKNCGSNGCFGNCGMCGDKQQCSLGTGVCEYDDAFFDADVWPILDGTCNTADCHEGIDPKGGMAMDTADDAFAALVGIGVEGQDLEVPTRDCRGETRVVGGDLAASYMLKKLGDDPDAVCGDLMPAPAVGFSRVPLPADKLATLRAWIATGARRAATP